MQPLLARIQEFLAAPRLEPGRVFHGRGQKYPGLEHVVVDWYPPLVMIVAYSEFEGAQSLAGHIQACDHLGQVESVLLQKRFEKGAPASWLVGEPLEEVVVTESGLNFLVKPGRRQNSGLFLDMRPTRQWLAANSAGKNVLNLFAYTCSLSVAALKGGASAVTNVDMSRPSLEWGRQNHALNDQPAESVTYIPHNLFKSWGRVRQFGRYDLVIIDPPTRQRGSFDAGKDYGAVLKRLASLVNPGAEVIACLNSPFLEREFLLERFGRTNPDAIYLEDMEVASEFADAQPQRGLKICRFRMPG